MKRSTVACVAMSVTAVVVGFVARDLMPSLPVLAAVCFVSAIGLSVAAWRVGRGPR